MKRTKAPRRLMLKRVTVRELAQPRGAGYAWVAGSYEDGCSMSCNTCQDGNDACGGYWYSALAWDCL